MREPVRLVRIPGEASRPAYRVRGTTIIVARISDRGAGPQRWTLSEDAVMSALETPAGSCSNGSWLSRAGLRDATFATRADALRAYAAAAAVEAPAHVAADRVQPMRRTARGVYEWCGHSITRAAGGWLIRGDAVGTANPAPAPTLRAAQEQIRHVLLMLQQWDEGRVLPAR